MKKNVAELKNVRDVVLTLYSIVISFFSIFLNKIHNLKCLKCKRSC